MNCEMSGIGKRQSFCACGNNQLHFDYGSGHN